MIVYDPSERRKAKIELRFLLFLAKKRKIDKKDMAFQQERERRKR